MQNLQLGFLKKTFNWNKYQWKVTMQVPSPYLDYLIDPSFQVVNRPLVLSFENSVEKRIIML